MPLSVLPLIIEPSTYQAHEILQRRKEGLHRSMEAFLLKLGQNGTKNEKMIGLEREGEEQWD